MARPTGIEIVRHVPPEELNRAASAYENEFRSYAKAKRIYERICFIRMRYRGYSVEEAASAAGMSMRSGYNIQELWNEGGMAALEPKFNGGRISKLNDDQRNEIVNMLSINPMSTKDVRLYVKEEYGLDYSEKHIHVTLKKMGLRHAKPYPRDHRSPVDAEAVLKKDSRMHWTT
jgi:putative transposase